MADNETLRTALVDPTGYTLDDLADAVEDAAAGFDRDQQLTKEEAESSTSTSRLARMAANLLRDPIMLAGKITPLHLRQIAHSMGFELHSKEFSRQAQALLREIPQIRKRLDELEKLAQ